MVGTKVAGMTDYAHQQIRTNGTIVVGTEVAGITDYVNTNKLKQMGL